MSISTKTFRHSAGFGKRMEHWIIGKMLKEGLDVYIPLVDDIGIDAVIRKPNGQFIEVQIKARSSDEHVFISQKGSIYSVQRINIILKDLKSKYNLKIKNFSTHSLRKCFGREVFNRSEGNAELALVKLSHLFNHSNPAITRRYLGVTQKELLDTYDVLSF